MFAAVYAAYLAAMSVFAFFLYLSDKRRAKKDLRRIPEKVLLGVSFLGGAAGGYVAMFVRRHKTRHWYFHAVHLIALAWQIALFVFLCTL